jgi:outer membrane protein
VAKEENYDMVVGEGVVYASKRVDITDKIVARLKAGK